MCAFLSVLLLIGAGWGMIDNNRARKWPLIAGLFRFPTPTFHRNLTHTNNRTGIVIVYGVCLGLSFFYFWFNIAAVLVLCLTLYVVFTMSMKSTQILSLKVMDFAAKIDTAEAHGSSDTEPGMNVPLLTSEKEHLQRQMVMLMFVFLFLMFLFEAFHILLLLNCTHRRFRFIIMAYIVWRLIVSIILLFVMVNWVEALLGEILDAFLFVCIGWVFRLRQTKKDGMYFVLENEFEEYSTPMDQLSSAPAPAAQPPTSDSDAPAAADTAPAAAAAADTAAESV